VSGGEYEGEARVSKAARVTGRAEERRKNQCGYLNSDWRGPQFGLRYYNNWEGGISMCYLRLDLIQNRTIALHSTLHRTWSYRSLL
jgi:hypothetical protein